MVPRAGKAVLLSSGEFSEQLGLIRHDSLTTWMHCNDNFSRLVAYQSYGRIGLWLRSEVLSWKTRRQTRTGD